MILSIGQSIQVVVAVIGLFLNVIVGLVVSIGLGLKSTDLILIFIIALLDSYYYLHNIVRMILIGVEYLVVDSNRLNPDPSWWCPFDATIDMSLYLACIELVAILSFMRYLSICRKKNLSPIVWYSIAAFSFCTNFIFSLVYIGNGYYKWSVTELVCVTGNDPESTNVGYIRYYNFWFTSYTVRSFISLVIIAFSYFNMTTVYYEKLSSSGDILMKNQLKSKDEDFKPQHTSQYFNTSGIENYNVQRNQIYKQKWFTVLKLMGAILAYSICLIPDITFNIIRLLPDSFPYTNITTDVFTASNLLLSCYGLVNSLFVLLSHDPSKRYLAFKLECFVNNVKGCLGFDC
ncbi:hypothetical protein K502DRAFT_234523 [Neoconidiobolus thromboides FSU 785]|nr:hypothetical protein K502DRAFT_234523 [Neoconidiobolus thromboides FSU 785]